MDIKAARRAIDELDAKLVSLLSQRMELSLKVARLKAAQGLEPRDLDREKAIIETAGKLARWPLTPNAVARVFETILDVSRAATAVELGQK